jgi:hypothetical protein
VVLSRECLCHSTVAGGRQCVCESPVVCGCAGGDDRKGEAAADCKVLCLAAATTGSPCELFFLLDHRLFSLCKYEMAKICTDDDQEMRCRKPVDG